VTTAVRKRHQLTGMKYDRVDLVPDGANAHAHILIAKNKEAQPKRVVTRKAMGQVQCNECGSKVAKSAQRCPECSSTDLATTVVQVTKTVHNPKKVPKNDDATNSTSNASGYTFEDQQYDQDNGENGQALGDAVERNVLKKSGGWFDVEVRKDDVDDVDNERFEHEKEGEDPDDDIEQMSMTKPVGTRPDRRSGYKNGATGAMDVTMMGKSRTGIKRKFLKEKPGRNSFDYADQGSQEIAESAEHMYRAESQPTPQAQERRESTMSDVFAKAARRRRKNSEGLDILENGNTGIYQRPGVKRNGTNTGHNKTTSRERTAVAPPGNPLDRGGVGKSFRVRKSNNDLPLMQLEALNIGVGLAENLGEIIRKGRADLYEETVEDFLTTLNAAFGEWQAGSTITKSKTVDAQAEDVAERVSVIIAKASPEAEMSDEASEGEDADDVDSKRPSIPSKKSQNAGEDSTSVGKNRFNKSLSDDDPYAGLHPEVVAKLKRLEQVEEERTHGVYLTKARELRGLPGFDEERIAKQLRNAYETLGDDEGDALFQTLSAASNTVQDSAVFKQFGLPGTGTSASEDPMVKAYAYADSSIQKGNVQKSREALVAEYMHQHPGEFYQPAKSA
jgi:DNA-directed RNA polymerase subunit RPC12/RpoP